MTFQSTMLLAYYNRRILNTFFWKVSPTTEWKRSIVEFEYQACDMMAVLVLYIDILFPRRFLCVLPFSHVFMSDIKATPEGQAHEWRLPGAIKHKWLHPPFSVSQGLNVTVNIIKKTDQSLKRKILTKVITTVANIYMWKRSTLI